MGRGHWWSTTSGTRRFLRLAAILGITSIVGISPWIVRNAAVHGEFVFIKNTFGYAFWQGNCALSEGTDKVVRPSVETALADVGDGLKGINESLWKARHEAGYLDDIALSRSDVAALGKLSEPERSRVLFRRALADLKASPGRYQQLCLRRLRYFVLFDETNPKTRNLVYRASHLGLTMLAGLGLLVMPGSLRRRLWPTFLTAGLIAAFHALTIVSARFHIPLEPLMGLWGAEFFCRMGQVFAGSDQMVDRDPPSSDLTPAVPPCHTNRDRIRAWSEASSGEVGEPSAAAGEWPEPSRR
jgi:hypothetical protein